MYAKKLSIYGFRCFNRAVLDLQYPGRPTSAPLDIPNVNLIVGENGGGKSSILRAIAIAVLAPALLHSGFVPYRLIRRPDAPHALLKLVCALDPTDLSKAPGSPKTIGLLARIDRQERGNLDRLHLEKTPSSPIEKLIYDDYSDAFFVVGYGATRRTETGEFSESSARRSRGLRYQRVAGLFEDHVTLRPMEAWLRKIKRQSRREEAIRKLVSVLPKPLTFNGAYDEDERQYVFMFDGRATPFTALSDGYKAFVGWVGDLIGHLCDVAPEDIAIDQLSGIVLIDEIDLHLHPAWQRTVVPTLATTFPKLQFVMTSHSPLIANTMRKENIFVTDKAEDGTATVKQIQESVHGRGSDQLLLSSYFGLDSTLPPALEATGTTLFERAAKGDTQSALAFLQQLSARPNTPEEVVSAVTRALNRPVGKKAPSRKKARATIKARLLKKKKSNR